jgi:hypothetical protein
VAPEADHDGAAIWRCGGQVSPALRWPLRLVRRPMAMMAQSPSTPSAEAAGAGTAALAHRTSQVRPVQPARQPPPQPAHATHATRPGAWFKTKRLLASIVEWRSNEPSSRSAQLSGAAVESGSVDGGPSRPRMEIRASPIEGHSAYWRFTFQFGRECHGHRPAKSAEISFVARCARLWQARLRGPCHPILRRQASKLE